MTSPHFPPSTRRHAFGTVFLRLHQVFRTSAQGHSVPARLLARKADRPLRIAGLMALMMATVSGCAMRENAPNRMELRPVPFATLPGWTQDHPDTIMPALLRDCRRLTQMAPEEKLGGEGVSERGGGKAGQWSGVCSRAQTVPAHDNAAARQFFERNFDVFQISNHGRTTGLTTGYYEPEIRGSRTQGGIFQTPIYGRPDDMIQIDLGKFDPELKGHMTAGRLIGGQLQPMPDRAQIEAGALQGRGLEILWLADPVDLFFLQVQGAGRVRMTDGSVVRVGFAGQNGHPYVAIGRLLAERHKLSMDQVSAQNIRAWLAAHPDQARQTMDANPSYVFFRELPNIRPEDGPPGTLGVPLTPERSVAVDRSYIPLGAPLWLDTTDPVNHTAWQHLVLAEDLGAAIKGPLRNDLFYGWGADAENRAGWAHQSSHAYLLLPRATPKN